MCALFLLSHLHNMYYYYRGLKCCVMWRAYPFSVIAVWQQLYNLYSMNILLYTKVKLNRPAEVLASVFGGASEFLFNTEDLVVLGKTFRAAGRTSLDLTGRQTDYEISNESVFSLSRPKEKLNWWNMQFHYVSISLYNWYKKLHKPVGNHGAPSIFLGQQVSINGLSDTANLVHLQEQAVASFLLDGGSNTLRVCYL